MMKDWTNARHTIVVSDFHLAEAEPVHPKNPLWKTFKRNEHFIDRSFKSFLTYFTNKFSEPIELVLNGDILDFDSVTALPTSPQFHISWLEKLRGLHAEEPKSRFKLNLILHDHILWLRSIREFIMKGNRVVFIIGNHDIDMHWPSVQQEFLKKLDLPEEKRDSIRFCEWFYISNQDTLIEHGNQYDTYCLCSNPINPLIKKRSHIYVRLPFGNFANKFMINGMGLKNPHDETTTLMNSSLDYMKYFYRHEFRTQPLLLWVWFWSSIVTLFYSVTEGLLPALRDPLTYNERIKNISEKSNALPSMVLSLVELHAHPAIFNPFKLLRELWLDRALFLVLIFAGSFQFFSFLNVFTPVSLWWWVIPFTLLLPVFVFYARSVEPEAEEMQKAAEKTVPISAQISKVRRVVHGHTHKEIHKDILDIEYLNTGTWSPAFHDLQCSKPYGRKCFTLITTPHGSSERKAELLEWKGNSKGVIHIGSS